jgi:hypothetical protein
MPPVGAPVSSEVGGCGDARRILFQFGSVVFTPAHGAFATYGLIGAPHPGLGVQLARTAPERREGVQRPLSRRPRERFPERVHRMVPGLEGRAGAPGPFRLLR